MKDSKISITAVVFVALLMAACVLEGRAAYILWAIIIGLIVFIVLIVGLVIFSFKGEGPKPDNGTKIGNNVYYDYDSEPYWCWPHNDTLYSFLIIRTDKAKKAKNLNTDEGWEIASFSETDPEGSCGEHKERTEVRKNGLSFYYNMINGKDCWWYKKHDLVRMLFDNDYFNKILEQANLGNAVAQTLIGCCYGHNGGMGQNVNKHDIQTALFWWKKAAEQGFPYAMRELAIYHWHKHEEKEAFQWNELSGNLCYVISRSHHIAIMDALRRPEENNEIKS